MPPDQNLLRSLRKMPVTLVLIVVNIMVFAITWIWAGALSGHNWVIALLRLGAQFNPLTLDSGWYRIFTHLFLHGGIIHLAAASYGLLYLGFVLEARIGSKKFIFVYIVAGIAAALSSMYWNLFTIGVGSSAAIFGLFGFALVLNIYFSAKNGKAMAVLLINLALFVAVHLLLPGAVYADYPAYFGGVMAGIFIGFFPYAKDGSLGFKKVRIEYLMISLLMILYLILPRYQVRYFKFFRYVVAAEDSTRQRYKGNLTEDQYMRGYIRNFHHWDDVLARLNGQKYVPAELASDTFKLRKYIALRKQENLFKKLVIQREAYAYMDSIEDLQEKMKPYLALDYGLWSRIKLEREPAASSMREMIKVLYDSNWLEVSSPPAAYYRVGYRDSLGRWDGVVRDFYNNGDILMKGSYRENKRHGVFRYYSGHDTYTSTGRYLDDTPMGKWHLFHINGKLSAEIQYNDGYFVQNLWDSVGNQLVVDGNGREIQRYPNGVIAVEGEYRHGLKDGYWHGRHPNGDMYFEEQYNRGVLTSGQSRTPGGETFVYDETSLRPMPEGGFEKFYDYVQEETKKVDDDDLGHVKISFRVTRNGVLADVSIDQSSGLPALDAKAKEILLNGPRWLPARNHGHEPVPGTGLVLIEFY